MTHQIDHKHAMPGSRHSIYMGKTIPDTKSLCFSLFVCLQVLLFYLAITVLKMVSSADIVIFYTKLWLSILHLASNLCEHSTRHRKAIQWHHVVEHQCIPSTRLVTVFHIDIYKHSQCP